MTAPQPHTPGAAPPPPRKPQPIPTHPALRPTHPAPPQLNNPEIMSAIEGALGQDPAFVQLVARQGAGVALPAPARVLLLEEVTSANEQGEQ